MLPISEALPFQQSGSERRPRPTLFRPDVPFKISDSQEVNGLGVILKSGDERGLRSSCPCLSAMASLLKRSMNLMIIQCFVSVPCLENEVDSNSVSQSHGGN